MFCKLFGPDDNQILAKLDSDENEVPEVRFYFQPENLGVCSIAVGFNDTDEGWVAAERFLKILTEEQARKLVDSAKAQILNP